ncbi:DgyrCDS4131 [Dimorphilus gyrociliatus]|uniref:DgyrCDS4131 n=1 Tax=Dimorphilus gyrociliatus TaxID=2664684 RepID=A0A7I8VGJ6_9ANNE|nr:DgyrCDS4131 [Dimorphilus gyrociliatus]
MKLLIALAALVAVAYCTTTLPTTTRAWGCPADNFCQPGSQICCWHEPTVSGCCNTGFKCCPSIRGDEHDCCPVDETACHENGSSNCYYNILKHA